MNGKNHSRRGGRLPRIARLLGRFHPEQPVTWPGNRVLLFPGGRSFFRSLNAALRTAERFVLAEYYLIRDDRTGRAFADALSEAVRRGVQVRLIYDYVGSIEAPAAFFQAMAEQGIELIPFNVPSFRRGLRWFDRRDHRKMTIIDGRVAYLGGFNIGDEYSGTGEGTRRFRDIGFSISGDAVGELVRSFSETWKMERGEPPRLSPARKQDRGPGSRRSAEVVIVRGGPHERRSYIHGAFLFHVASASEEILIATPYFVPGLRMIRSLLRAARRGVVVRLLLPAVGDIPIVRLLGRSYYGALLGAGIEIRELEQEILHAKVMVIDGRRTVIGSANLDQRSFHRNYELNAVIDDAPFGRQIRRTLLKDMERSRRITSESHERRGVFARLLERVIDLIGWLL